MVAFDLWSESFIFIGFFAVIVIIPCVIVTLIGRGLINRLGQYPSKTPVIQLSIIIPLILTELFTFVLFIGFYQFFTSG